MEGKKFNSKFTGLETSVEINILPGRAGTPLLHKQEDPAELRKRLSLQMDGEKILYPLYSLYYRGDKNLSLKSDGKNIYLLYIETTHLRPE